MATASDNSASNLIWLDLEMTGLQPDSDRIIEMAFVVTDAQLNVLAASPSLVIHQPDEVLDAMDSWNRGTHGKSGLIERVRASTLN
ncbi:MAG TPA: oligoribonuclease, partial [Burkholderiales bacterium]|nr:oligoribonuclease [Burkholderiales bacterium]